MHKNKVQFLCKEWIIGSPLVEHTDSHFIFSDKMEDSASRIDPSLLSCPGSCTFLLKQKIATVDIPTMTPNL